MHYHKINEMDNPRSRRSGYVHYMRRFWHWERHEAHIETYVRKHFKENPISIRFHAGNEGSETPWDGHLIFLWFGIFWGHTFFRKLASRISRCDGYMYDSRDWAIRIRDRALAGSMSEPSAMWALHPRTPRNHKPPRGYRTGRRGSISI